MRRAHLVTLFVLVAAPQGCGGDETSQASASTSGGSPACTPPETAPPELIEPDPTRPWAGAVAVVTEGALSGMPHAGWRVDGETRPPPKPTLPVSLLDTEALADGEHRLSLDLVGSDQQLFTVETRFCVENGPEASPAFSGTLVDVSDTSGLEPSSSLEVFSGAVAGDLDGDGDVDLFVWSAEGARVYLQVAPFVFAPGPIVAMGVETAGMGDLDGDGDLDIVAAGSGVAIFRNDGGSLVDVTEGAPVFPAGATYRFRSVGMADLDRDGLLDVGLTQLDCQGAPNFVLRNEGDMHFADVAAALSLETPLGASFGMAMDILADEDDAHVFLFHEGCTPGQTTHVRLGPGNDLPVVLETSSPKLSRVSPMGSAFFDANGDGLLDLWLAGDFTNPLLRAPDFYETEAPYVGVDVFLDPAGAAVSAWSMVLFDADLDGLPDVFVPHHPSDPALGDVASSRDGLFWQRSPGQMRDVALQAGLAGTSPCRAAFGSDLDGDGDTDLLVGCLFGVRVLRNDLVDPAAGRTLHLRGAVSNGDGIGAIITTPSGEKRLVRGSGQPYAGGVTRETVAAASGSIEVLWPSGIKQTASVGDTSILLIDEPRAVTVAPRRVATGGGQAVSVEVNPAALGDAAAAVTVTPSAGTWSKPLAKEQDGVFRGTLAPPSEAKTVVITVQIGAQTLRVRPRVFVR